MPSYLLKTVLSCNTNSKFYVSLKHFNSGTYPIKAGVPQGSVLGPILFNFYTHDCPTSPNSNNIQFADDTLIYASGFNCNLVQNALQSHQNLYSAWSFKWNVDINPTKTQFKIFTSRRPKSIAFNNITVNNANIKALPSTTPRKYPGFLFDTRLNWKCNILHRKLLAQIKLRTLYPILNPASPLSLPNRIQLYKSILRPVLTYGAHIWGSDAKSNTNHCQIFQNKILRLATKSPWFISNN